MMKKPLLYIDVDGVLFGIYGTDEDTYPQLRPNAVLFLLWCVQHFECYWLTAWPKARLDTLFGCLMAPDLKKIPEAPVLRLARSSFSKIDCIDVSRDFYWIEDGIGEQQQVWLAEHDVADRYIPVDPHGRDALESVWATLRKIALYAEAEQETEAGWEDGKEGKGIR